MEEKKKISALIVAAGQGRRMGGAVAKQYLLLEGKEILAHTVEVFEASSKIDEIVLVTGKDAIEDVRGLEQKYGWKKIKAIVSGGAERGDSVQAGLCALSLDSDIVLIHDGVRPLIEEVSIESSICTAEEMGACAVGVPVKDTIKVCDKDGFALSTPERSTLWQIQTPQTFQVQLIQEAYAHAAKDGFMATDDTSVVAHMGHPVKIILGEYKNIKITTQEDLLIASSFLEEGKD